MPTPFTVARKLREPVDGRFLTAPIEGTRPVFDERAQSVVIRSECPSVVDLVRPASPPQPILKIVQRPLGHIDEELIDAHHFRHGLTSANHVPRHEACYSPEVNRR